ncbi:MAG: FabA/FabZ family ACP-dehydratase [Sediminicola sp.]
MDFDTIIKQLPYAPPFLFVDRLLRVDEDGAEGEFTFLAGMDFYKGHFKENPVTPGVLLTECCAQIGLVCLGLYLIDKSDTSSVVIGMSSSEMEFFQGVYPNTKVRVVSEKIYFRFQKLKCKVRMFDQEDRLICKGVLAGMLKKGTDGK